MQALLFNPIYQTRVWGGDRLASRLGRTLPCGDPIGESWEIVDRPEACSTVALGPFAGWTLERLRRECTLDLMGPGYDPEMPFPILVKWLDCRARLSLQVHPPAAVAPELGGEPKTENWFVVEADVGAALLAGLERGVTPEAFRAALEADEAEKLVRRLPTSPGDSLFVPSGRLHAIDAGNLILEIQQNSDTTFRVYDWGRVGLDGKPRQLHIEESMRSILFDDPAPELLHTAGRDLSLVESEIFNLRKEVLAPMEPLTIPAGEQPRILSVVSGELIPMEASRLAPALRRGDNALLAYATEAHWHAGPEGTEILLTEGFAPSAREE